MASAERSSRRNASRVFFRTGAPLAAREGRRTRVLVTGVGAAAGAGFLYLAERFDVDFYAADTDPVASGLYLVPAERRLLLPHGDAPEFVTTVLEVCRRLEIDVLVPTLDSELLPLVRARHALAEAGTALLAAPEPTLVACLDPAELARVCADCCAAPEDLPGEELSVDVFVRADGVVVSAVPRTRDKVDSGVAVAGRTVADAECVAVATAVARAVGLRGIGTVQLRRRADGRPALLKVVPRASGSLVLTAAAGPNLAALALSEVLGESVPARVPFRELAMVRFLAETVVELDDYAGARMAGALG